MSAKTPLARWQTVFPYRFRQVKLLETALSHSSYANENGTVSYERLEFLGDAVLELCVSERLYKHFPQAREGEMTKMRARLVNEKSLAKLSKKLGLQKYLLLGKGEENQGGRENEAILSDVVEAILGAVFLDGGFEAAKHVLEIIMEDISLSQSVNNTKDAKSRLQEITQRLHAARPNYSTINSTGPEHDKQYTVSVTLPNQNTFQATASSVKKAEQMAAKQAIQWYTDGNHSDLKEK